MASFPIVMSSAGYVPQTPVALNQMLIANVSATNPGYTANLPGSLIEDISSTDTYAMLQMDSSIAEILNSITPYGANLFLLNQLSDVYGVDPQLEVNTSVYLIFSGPPGYVIAQGVTVTDGNYFYIVQDGGIIGTAGVSLQLYAVSPTVGAWAVPAGTVTEISTSIPTGINLTVTNPSAGVPSTSIESVPNYRARVLQAGYAPGQGMITYLKTILGNIQGVQSRLISARLISSNPYLWEIICGGGDPYQVAYGIFTAGLLLSSLSGSILSISNISNANPGVVTTVLNHGYATGQSFEISGATGITGINNTPLTATVLTPNTFSIGINTTSSGAYTGGGVLSPNLRNITAPVYDYPDTYSITFVNPPQQYVSISLLYNTIATNFVSPVAVAQLAIPAIVDYINSIPVGQPINIFVLNSVVQLSVASLIPAQLLTRLVFSVNINGVGSSPISGTGEIPGDPESYFYTDSTQITVTEG